MQVETSERDKVHEGALAPRRRSCVGCGEHVGLRSREAAAGLVRLVVSPGGEVAVDASRGGFGRGAYVHARRGCIEKAVARGLPRALQARPLLASPPLAVSGGGSPRAPDAERSEAPRPLAPESLVAAVHQALERRIRGLLAAAVRSRAVALGTEATAQACREGGAALVVVACDAAAAADREEIRRAIADGRAVAWGTKASLAAACAPRLAEREGLAVLGIRSPGLSLAVREAVRAVDAVSSGAGVARGRRG